MRRILGSLMVLTLALATGCSRSDDAASAASDEASKVQARALPAIWADILAQRDRIHAVAEKGTDVWHEDCAELASAAAALDLLVIELNQRVVGDASLEPRRRRIDEMIGFLNVTATTFREKAVDESVGSFASLMIGLDAVLKGVEDVFTRDELGGDSVVTRPGFNNVRPPKVPSPV